MFKWKPPSYLMSRSESSWDVSCCRSTTDKQDWDKSWKKEFGASREELLSKKNFRSNGWAFSCFEQSGWLASSEVSERDVWAIMELYSQMTKCFLFLTSQTQKQFCVGISTDRCRIAKFNKAGWSVAEMHSRSLVRFPLQIGAKKNKLFFFEMAIKYICEMTAFPFRDVMCNKKKVFFPLTLSHSKKRSGGCSGVQVCFHCNICMHQTVMAFAQVSFLH